MQELSSIPLLYTLNCGNLYGTERMALATLEQFDDYIRFVFAPASSTSPSLLEMAAARKYQTRRVEKPLEMLFALFPVFMRHRRIDVISTSVRLNLICAWLGRLLFVRLRQLNVVHGGGQERDSYAKKHLLNKTSIQIVAVSQFVRNRLLAHGVDSKKITVIGNFLSTADVAGRARRPSFDVAIAHARPLDPLHVKVAVVSRLDTVKRLDVLLDAVGTGQLERFHFDVFGAGEPLAEYEERARAMGGHITFHGYVSDVAARLPQADLFLHLCPDEPFGLVVLEAFAARLPVLAPNTGGPSELVEHGISGIVYPATDVAALVACLLHTATLSGASLDMLAAGGQAALSQRYSAARGLEGYRRAFENAGR